MIKLKILSIDRRISRAIETSVHLSSDRVIIEWFKSGEGDGPLGKMAKERLTSIKKAYDCSTVFAG